MSGIIDRATSFVWNSASWCDGTLRTLPYANNIYTYVYDKVGTVYNVVVPKLHSGYNYTVPAIKEHYYISGGVGVVLSFFLIRALMSPEDKR